MIEGFWDTKYTKPPLQIQVNFFFPRPAEAGNSGKIPSLRYRRKKQSNE